jgi:hypothetical protein
MFFSKGLQGIKIWVGFESCGKQITKDDILIIKPTKWDKIVKVWSKPPLHNLNVFKEVWLHLKVKKKYYIEILPSIILFFPFINDNCVIIDVSMHCKNLSFLEFFVTSNHIEVLFIWKEN